MPILFLLFLFWGCASHTPVIKDRPHLAQPWWEQLQNQKLNLAIERSFTHPSLEQFLYKLKEIEALKSEARARLLPLLRADATATGSDDFSTSYSLAFSLDFDPDIFFKNRDLLQASGFDVVTSELELVAAKNEWAAQIVKDYGGYCYQRRLVAQMQDYLEQAKVFQKLAFAYYKSGEGSLRDYLLAKSQLVRARNDLQIAKLQVKMYKNALEYEVGEVIECAKMREPKIKDFSLKILERRADLLALKFSMLAAAKRYDNAKKNILPDLKLSTILQTKNSSLESLVSQWLLRWSLSLGVRLFEGGALRAQQEAKKMRFLQIKKQYEDALLRALKKIKDAKAQIVKAQRQRDSLQKEYAIAKMQEDVAKKRYIVTESDALDLVSTRMERLRKNIDVTKACYELFVATVEYLKQSAVVGELH